MERAEEANDDEKNEKSNKVLEWKPCVHVGLRRPINRLHCSKSGFGDSIVHLFFKNVKIWNFLYLVGLAYDPSE